MPVNYLGVPSRPPRGPKSFRYVDTSFEATFFLHNGNQLDVLATAEHTRTGKPSSDIVAASTTKHLAQPVGEWSLTLVPRELDYFKELSPGEWCEIRGDNGDGNGMRTLMYGPIRDIQRDRSIDARSGAPQTLVQMSGKDFALPFVNTEPLYDARLAEDPGLSQFSLAAAVTGLGNIIGHPPTIVTSIIDIYLSALEQWHDPRTGSTFGLFEDNFFDYVAADVETLGKATFEPINLSSSLWQTLQQWANLSVNEMFVDYRPPIGDPGDLTNVVPAFVLRQQPLWGTAWDNLPVLTVTRDEVTSEKLKKSADDVRNWIRAVDEPRVTGTNIAVYANKIGMLNPESIKKFGFQRHEMTTPFIFPDEDQERPQSQIDLVAAHSALQALWHHSNELLQSGTFATYFRPEARVGYRLDLENVGEPMMQFYIESVTHTFQYPGVSQTVLGVTRGRFSDDATFTADINALVDNGTLLDISDTVEQSASKLSEVLG